MAEFPLQQQGGPLILFLELKRIRNASEAAMDALKAQFRAIKIKKIKGEDVELVCQYIKSIRRAFESASRPDRSFVPDDFCETCYDIMQTSSVEPFNRVFRDEKESLLREGDKQGIIPEFPEWKSILSLAAATYARLIASGRWNVPTKKEAALTAQPGKPQGTRPGGDRPKRRCYNCGSDDHLLPDCPHPRDEAKITKAREEFAKNKRRNPQQQNKGKPKAHKASVETKVDSKGRALCLNKNKEWVVDQKALKSKQAEDKQNEAIKALTAATTPQPRPSEESPVSPSPSQAPTTLTPVRSTMLDPEFLSNFAQRYIR
jgi:hypothetical protein